MGGQQQSESYADLPGHLLQDFLFMEQEEIWQPIVGFEGFYEVSNTGKVRSLKRHVKSALKNNRTVNRKGAITKQFLRDNYYSVRLYKEGKPKNKRVNILVCAATQPVISEGMSAHLKRLINRSNEVEKQRR